MGVSLDAVVSSEKVCLGIPFRAMITIACRYEHLNFKHDQVYAAASIYRVEMSRAEREIYEASQRHTSLGTDEV